MVLVIAECGYDKTMKGTLIYIIIRASNYIYELVDRQFCDYILIIYYSLIPYGWGHNTISFTSQVMDMSVSVLTLLLKYLR